MDVPNLPSISTKATPSEIRNAFNILRNWFKSLKESGFGTTATVGTSGGSADLPDALDPYLDTSSPPKLTGFVVSGAFRTIELSWIDPAYLYYSHVEIWRADTDNLGQAVLIGTTEANVYPDTPSQASLSKTYYYWIRCVSIAGNEGPFNATVGTPGSTADDPSYVLELLQNGKWKPLTAVSLNAYGYATRPNGRAYKATVAGTTGTTEPVWPTTVGQTVVDGTVTWSCDADLELESPFMVGLVNGVVRMVLRDVLIGDETVTNSKVHSLSADKLYAAVGTIAEIIIGSGHITNAMIANILQSTNYVPGLAGWIINKNGDVEFNAGVFRGAVQFLAGSGGYGNLSDRPTSLAGISQTDATTLAGANSRSITALNNAATAQSSADYAYSYAAPAYTRMMNWTRTGTTLIDGGKLYTDDAFIYSAMIHDAQVGTLKIAGNAVTIPVSVYTEASVSAGTVQSATITTDGTFPILIFGSIVLSLNSSPGTIMIQRDGSTIWSRVISVQQFQTYEGMITPELTDQPSSGTYTYSIVVSGNLAYASNRCLTLMGVKR
jgi:hypothetical protein